MVPNQLRTYALGFEYEDPDGDAEGWELAVSGSSDFQSVPRVLMNPSLGRVNATVSFSLPEGRHAVSLVLRDKQGHLSRPYSITLFAINNLDAGLSTDTVAFSDASGDAALLQDAMTSDTSLQDTSALDAGTEDTGSP